MVANLPKDPQSSHGRGASEGVKKAGWYELVSNPGWYRMQARFGAYVLFALIAAPLSTAAAGQLPDIKAGPANKVPECVTPGRLLAYLKTRNPELSPRFESLPSDYMRVGEDLGVRWDFAFYQMMLETGSLSFKNGSRTGDVKPTQNNFAGLGATGRGEPGESFPDVATGVRAHLEHLLLYSGQTVESPVAERTRKVQQWGVLTQWQAGFKRPITFADLAAKWAPGSNAYGRMLESLSQGFSDYCRRPDPKPELLAAVRKSRLAAQEEAPAERPGAALAKRAIDEGKAEQNNRRSALGNPENVSPSVTASLGGKVPPTPFKVLNSPVPQEEPQPLAQPLAHAAPPPAPPAAEQPAPSPAFRSGMLNMPARQPPPAFHNESAALPPPPPALPAASETQLLPHQPAAKAPAVQPPAAHTQPSHQAKANQPAPPRKEQPNKVASAATSAKSIADAVPAGQKCRVWTASYGGQKALIIRSVIDRVVNFTVLDVNEGAEKREADAFIAAYAKNGAVAGEFASQTIALDKAFELCPEG